MSATEGKPIIIWTILVYDRSATDRFPLKQKTYRFNYDRATESEAQEVIRLCSHESRDEIPITDIEGSERWTIQLNINTGTVKQILKYRHLFDNISDESNLFADASNARGILNMNLWPDSYIEDENQQAISWVQMMDEESVRKYGKVAIILDHPESILRYGPADPVRSEKWQPDSAGLMIQLLDVYDQLIKSRWIKSPFKVTLIDKVMRQAILPIREDCRAIIVLFRQLYSKDSTDDLFNRCCIIHNCHCPPEHCARWWIAHYRTQFNKFLEKTVRNPFLKTTLPARRYLDAIAYGTNLIHASSKKDETEADLDNILAANNEKVVMIGYHDILQTLLVYVSMTIPVLRQNVTHWIRDLNWPVSGIPKGRDLFGA